MASEKNISIKDYHYDLPDNRIAIYPLAQRDLSKLLIYQNGVISESQYLNIDGFLPSDSIMFFNNTKVIPARLFFKTSGQRDIEIFCLEPISDKADVYASMAQVASVRWKCLVGGAAKWKEQFVSLTAPHLQIRAEIVERLHGTFILEFTWQPCNKTFAEILQIAGAIPIPPYLKRATEDVDLDRYQTVYACKEGSVAAPTAGLHFTDRVFDKLHAKNISVNYMTLHVGAGTFKPVKSETMANHDMHGEYLDVSIETINYLFENSDAPITAVGTTSLRTLESLYWLGSKIFSEPSIQSKDLIVNQWQPYEAIDDMISLHDALKAILDYLNMHQLKNLYAKTNILIVPGYRFKVVSALVTNFHQPESTLILLVAAFIGEDWRKVYNYALQHDYRFLSYGDGTLLYRKV